MSDFDNKTFSQDSAKSSKIKQRQTQLVSDAMIDEYKDALHTMFIASDDITASNNARQKLIFYDSKLKEMGLRFTIKLGVEKINKV